MIKKHLKAQHNNILKTPKSKKDFANNLFNLNLSKVVPLP